MTEPEEVREEYRAWVEERAKAAAVEIEAERDALRLEGCYDEPSVAEIIARHFLGP